MFVLGIVVILVVIVQKAVTVKAVAVFVCI